MLAPVGRRGGRDRRAFAASEAARGRRTGSRPQTARAAPGGIDVSATLAAAAVRQALDGRRNLPLQPTRHDLWRRVHRKSHRRLVILAVDLSDSMAEGPKTRMSAALGAALSLTAESYLNRDLVSVVTFRDRQARVLVPPTASVYLVRRRLQRVTVGGATPLADGLLTSLRIIGQMRVKHPGIEPLLVLVSDGEATCALRSEGDPAADALQAARSLRRQGCRTVLIDTSIEPKSSNLMPRIAEILAVGRHRLHHITAGRLLDLLDETGQNQMP
ncbi:MAG TPA: VWA domain-containing protein [Desulfuromonadales bacterium]|nr:VWA domain-containing protein [Desulfuromonadales bacterium]